MPEIADFDKPFSEHDKVPCVCGHARVFHEPRVCLIAGCTKCKGFTPRPPELPMIAMMGAALGPRQIMWRGNQAYRAMPDGVWMAVNLDARKPTPHSAQRGTHTTS